VCKYQIDDAAEAGDAPTSSGWEPSILAAIPAPASGGSSFFCFIIIDKCRSYSNRAVFQVCLDMKPRGAFLNRNYLNAV
jgi:hypothetical protein